MKLCVIIITQLLLLVVLTAAQNIDPVKKEEVVRDNEAAEEIAGNDVNREKRGFLLTPLASLPAAALEPLLPFLRAALPAPLLNKVSGLLPTAQLVDGSSVSAPRDVSQIPAVLSATAPFVNERATAESNARQLAALLNAKVPFIASGAIPQVLQTNSGQSVLVTSVPANLNRPIVTNPAGRVLFRSPVQPVAPAIQTPIVSKVVAYTPRVAPSTVFRATLPVAPPVVPNLASPLVPLRGSSHAFGLIHGSSGVIVPVSPVARFLNSPFPANAALLSNPLAKFTANYITPFPTFPSQYLASGYAPQVYPTPVIFK